MTRRELTAVAGMRVQRQEKEHNLEVMISDDSGGNERPMMMDKKDA